LIRLVWINRKPGKFGESLDIVAGEHKERDGGGAGEMKYTV
jgi:hypothetical protein